MSNPPRPNCLCPIATTFDEEIRGQVQLNAPVCCRCGLVSVLHDGEDNLASTKGCDGFVGQE